MKKCLIVILFSLLILAISSCTTSNEVLESNPGETEGIPIPGDTTGVVYGYLFSQENKPINESIFLSRDIAYDQTELPVTISFSMQSDPRGILDSESGFFYFDDIQPGDNYVITIFAGSGKPIYVMEDNDDIPLVFSVEAGETLNLGELFVELGYE